MKTLTQWKARRSGDAITITGQDESGREVKIKVTEIIGNEVEGAEAHTAQGDLYRLA